VLGLTLANRYRVDRLIGTGGMSVVYQAEDVALGRTVAVKLFRVDSAEGTNPNRQSGEVSMLAHLNHFALVTLYDAGTELIDGLSRPFIVTEFVDGSDLRSRIRQGPIDPGDVARLGADLCAALHYVHSKGIIHRDIKPANVLLAPSDFPGRGAHAKLADFGIARLFDAAHQTMPGAVIGTAGYLSPEQARGQPVGPAAMSTRWAWCCWKASRHDKATPARPSSRLWPGCTDSRSCRAGSARTGAACSPA